MQETETNLKNIRDHLNEGRRITCTTALFLYGTTELRHYVAILRKEGLNILDEHKLTGTGYYKEYYIPQKIE